ncbi:hypothetical protein WJX74_000863 [Apatococcus lobatus]|uniref:RING-CH-type domain-containing protein n=1 Tax=Apatococcus lobatus TaxID=904363 RepID=A0AAW1Q9A6_9CHLO
MPQRRDDLQAVPSTDGEEAGCPEQQPRFFQRVTDRFSALRKALGARKTNQEVETAASAGPSSSQPSQDDLEAQVLPVSAAAEAQRSSSGPSSFPDQPVLAAMHQGSPTAANSPGNHGTDTAAGNELINRLVRAESSKGLQHSGSGGGQAPVCLICLDNLTAEDFESGEAMALECQCRGELALRHRGCAIKWTRVKGDNICDICKAPITNLPQVSPRAPTERSEGDASMFEDADERAAHMLHGSYVDSMPSSADVIFDCIRVTWVAMIICILFFDMELATALWTGLVVGIAYTLFVRAMYRSQLAAVQREQAREQERRAAATGQTGTPGTASSSDGGSPSVPGPNPPAAAVPPPPVANAV